jgi:hypothetical protein
MKNGLSRGAVGGKPSQTVMLLELEEYFDTI